MESDVDELTRVFNESYV